MKQSTVRISILTGLFAVIIAGLNVPCAAQSWTQLAPSGGPPSPREVRSDSIFDPATNQLINFGGRSGPTNLNDVWSLTLGANPQWTLVTTSGSPPAPRVRHTVVYDSANSRMIIFGGGLGSSSPCANDVWVLGDANGVSGTPAWTQLSPTGEPPTPRLVHTAVYDPTSNSMIIFGGNDCFSGFYSDVWVLSNANGLGGTPNWTQLSPAGTSPGPRGYDSAVYDPGSNRMIFFGAGPAGSSDNITWILSNANGLGGTPTWSQLAPSGTAPSIRDSHTAVYDVASNRMTLFGGNGYVNNVLMEFNDVWVLSNANGLGGTPAWTQLAPTGTLPPSRVLAAAVNDPATNRMIIFGGSSFLSNVSYNDAWVLTPPNAYAAQVQQPINADGSSVFNAKRGVVPVKFTLTLNDAPTCLLPPATITLTRTSGSTPGSIDESVFLQTSDNGSNFRIDSCQYVYNLATGSLGAGTYVVQITISGNTVGSGTFGLR